MNRSRLLFIGVLALALGAFVSFVVYKNMLAKTHGNSEPGADVIVAASDLQVGSKLQSNDIRQVKVPSSVLPPNSYKLPSQVLGRGVILPIKTGEFILPSKLADAGAGSGLPSLIPSGMRAVSVRVNEVVAVAGFVVPGTRVDVLLTGNPGGNSENQTTTVLENIAVLAAGQKLERNAAGEPQSVPVITLLVSPEDAQKLTLASQEGRIQLALRNPLDTTQQKLPSVRNAVLYGAAAPTPTQTATKPKVKRAAPKPVTPTAPSAYTIEVIRGQEKKEITFEQ